MRKQHPVVVAKIEEMKHTIGYDDAAALVRLAKDHASVTAGKEIDATLAKEKQEAAALTKDSLARLGLSSEQARALVAKLADSPDLDTWLSRRVALHRAHGESPADDFHHVNE